MKLPHKKSFRKMKMKIKQRFNRIKNQLKLLKRDIKFLYQRKTRGFDDSEMWNLDYSLAKLILPRLKLFRQTYSGLPAGLTKDQYEDILDEMIWTFTWYCGEQWSYGKDYTANSKRADDGLKLFAEYFGGLWT